MGAGSGVFQRAPSVVGLVSSALLPGVVVVVVVVVVTNCGASGQQIQSGRLMCRLPSPLFQRSVSVRRGTALRKQGYGNAGKVTGTCVRREGVPASEK
ncbi:hypothetical protein GQ53DRAFT_744563 [Thozetella sp. PMI_491]|nr:hypothetical protein GQ53DRAFT_744563 [Thozetella sp. PMI_491]